MNDLKTVNLCRYLMIGAGLLLSMHGAFAQSAPARVSPPSVVAVQVAEDGTVRHKRILTEAGSVNVSGTAEPGEAADDHADGEHNDDGPGLDNDHGGDRGDGDGEQDDDGTGSN